MILYYSLNLVDNVKDSEEARAYRMQAPPPLASGELPQSAVSKEGLNCILQARCGLTYEVTLFNLQKMYAPIY